MGLREELLSAGGTRSADRRNHHRRHGALFLRLAKVGGDPDQSASAPNSYSTIFNRPLGGIHHTFYCEAGWDAVVTDATGATTQSPLVVAAYPWELGD